MRRGGKRARAGFSMVEMMVSVGIAATLSATAIPAFKGMVSRSKTGEVTGNLNSMFKLAASYYAAERGGQGNAAGVSGYCTVGDAGPVPVQPLPQKQAFVSDQAFRGLGFSLADYTYFSYGVIAQGAASSCGNPPNNTNVYTFYANGDLDGDTIESTFELAAGADASNVLYHTRAFFIDREVE